MDKNLIIIEGNIGVGKTSLAKKISENMNAQLVLEKFADNPFLEKFYKDQKQYAFTLEMSFMAERFNQLMNELQNRDLFKDFVVTDYYFMKSLIFAGVTLSDDEYNLYRKFFDIIYQRVPRPDLYVYLHKSTSNLKEQIQIRGRSYEQDIKKSYLEQVTQSYFKYFKQELEFPVLIIDTNGIDFVKYKADYNKIIDAIFYTNYKIGINRIIL